MVKVIFLDIDGVMNNYKCEVSNVHHSLEFYPDSVHLLKKLINKTKAKLVISSSWRVGETVNSLNEDVLSHYKLDKYVVGFTPILEEEIRGNEIKQYLLNNQHIEQFIILDDDADMGDYIERLVRTKISKGFTNKEYEKALKLLS